MNVVEEIRKFVEDLSRSIEKNGHEHIEYVPTQVVTEYFRYKFKTDKSENIHGILYPSSRNIGGICCVLFCKQENCIEHGSKTTLNPNTWLSLEEVYHK